MKGLGMSNACNQCFGEAEAGADPKVREIGRHILASGLKTCLTKNTKISWGGGGCSGRSYSGG